MICIKPISTDIHVSGSIKRDGAWELQTVNNVIKAMQRFPNATFLGGRREVINWSQFDKFDWSDIGANIGMYSVVVAACNRSVVAVDADPYNLAYIRRSLDLGGHTPHVRIIYNSVRWERCLVRCQFIFCAWVLTNVLSDEYRELYPYAPDVSNVGGTLMKTAEQVKAENIVTKLVKEILKIPLINEGAVHCVAPHTVRDDERHS